jgi:imidazole glycerol-phosphate synthase subunit HisF
MPKKRLIGSLIMRDGWIVQSIGFSRYLPVGRPEIAARFLDDWGVDEILLLDIGATSRGELIDPETVARVSASCYVPLAVGGGIKGAEDVRALIRAGADKVAINTAAVESPESLSEAVHMFGSQCIIAALDVRRITDGHDTVTGSGCQLMGKDPVALAQALAKAGAGEILLHSVDCDGSKQGYDLAIIDSVAGAVNLPVIAMGGAGHPEHVREVLSRSSVSAAAVGNMLHYSEHSVAVIKQYLAAHGIDIRRDAEARYEHVEIDKDGRVAKLPDDVLAHAVFEFIPKEVI